MFNVHAANYKPNYKLWPVLECIVCTRLHHNLDSFKQVLVEAADNFPMDVLRTVINSWPNRL